MPTQTTHRGRRPGQHARAVTRAFALRLLIAVVGVVACTLLAGVELGFGSMRFASAELVAIAVLLGAHRVFWPVIARWDRGADGEERVGSLLDGLATDGWHALHDVAVANRGNIDHILVGPAGILTVETKSHRGRIKLATIPDAMINQAYAQAKVIERITGEPVKPLLVFSRAYLDEVPGFRRGVVILPARMLAGYLNRRRGTLGRERAAELARLLEVATLD